MLIFCADGSLREMSKKQWKMERRQEEIEKEITKNTDMEKEDCIRRWKNLNKNMKQIKDAMHEVVETGFDYQQMRADLDDLVKVKIEVEKIMWKIEKKFISLGGYRWELLLAD